LDELSRELRAKYLDIERVAMETLLLTIHKATPEMLTNIIVRMSRLCALTEGRAAGCFEVMLIENRITQFVRARELVRSLVQCA